MKKTLAVIATFFSVVIIIFFAAAFIQMKMNPALWPEDTRLGFVFASLILGFFASLGMASALDD